MTHREHQNAPTPGFTLPSEQDIRLALSSIAINPDFVIAIADYGSLTLTEVELTQAVHHSAVFAETGMSPAEKGALYAALPRAVSTLVGGGKLAETILTSLRQLQL